MRAGHRLLATLIGAALVVASCDKNPTGPSLPNPGGPGAPPPVTVVRIEIVAPASVAPTATVQLTARAVKSDGSVEEVTRDAQWSSTNGRVIVVSNTGLATGFSRGEANINARYQSHSASALVMVLPEGTFRLDGRFTDGGFPLPGVQVEVISGTGEGLAAVTGDSGAYSLYGVAGQVKLQAKKEGYRNQIQDLDVTGHRTLNLEMAVDGERPKLAGTYTLEIEAGRCTSNVSLPDDARRRTYTAIVEQEGPRVSVRLTGADFIVSDGRGDHFAGLMVNEEDLRLEIGGAIQITSSSYYWYHYYYFVDSADLVERLSPSSAFVAAGTVEADGSATGISGLLRGWIVLARDVVPPFDASVRCRSDDHRFEMRRR